MAAYESLEHGVPSVRHYAAVQRMRNIPWSRILSIPRYDGDYNKLRGNE